MHIHSVPGKVEVAWSARARAIVDTWHNYSVTLEEFRDAVLVKGLNHARANGGIAWIVDSSKAKGAFSQQIQDFIGTDVFPAFAAHGIKYFITISPESAITKMTVRRYQQQTGPHGLELVETASKADAEAFLEERSGA